MRATPDRVPHRNANFSLDDILPDVWLYVVVGIPLVLLILKHGWSRSFQDGDFSLLAVGVLTAAIFEEATELHRDRADVTPRMWRVFGVAAAVYGGGFLLPNLTYFITAGSGNGGADWVRIVMFWLAIMVAYLIRFPAMYALTSSSVHPGSDREQVDG